MERFPSNESQRDLTGIQVDWNTGYHGLYASEENPYYMMRR